MDNPASDTLAAETEWRSRVALDAMGLSIAAAAALVAVFVSKRARTRQAGFWSWVYAALGLATFAVFIVMMLLHSRDASGIGSIVTTFLVGLTAVGLLKVYEESNTEALYDAFFGRLPALISGRMIDRSTFAGWYNGYDMEVAIERPLADAPSHFHVTLLSSHGDADWDIGCRRIKGKKGRRWSWQVCSTDERLGDQLREAGLVDALSARRYRGELSFKAQVGPAYIKYRSEDARLLYCVPVGQGRLPKVTTDQVRGQLDFVIGVARLNRDLNRRPV